MIYGQEIQLESFDHLLSLAPQLEDICFRDKLVVLRGLTPYPEISFLTLQMR